MKIDRSTLSWVAGAFLVAVAIHSGIPAIASIAWKLIRLALLIAAAYGVRNWVIAKYGNPIVGVGCGLLLFFVGWGVVL
jgi:hypothetical protein